MQCPKCSAGMEQIDFKGVEIDRCLRCHGIWFDDHEKEKLSELDDASTLDLGIDETTAEYNEMVFVECPNCFSILDQVEEQDPPIRYEFCRTCHGSFFDGGEFLEYLAAVEKKAS